jgi:hypothetical protein
MILPDIETGPLDLGRRVTIFPRFTRESSRKMSTHLAWKATRNGIIPLTFTA